jgi:hypothetical protein
VTDKSENECFQTSLVTEEMTLSSAELDRTAIIILTGRTEGELEEFSDSCLM